MRSGQFNNRKPRNAVGAGRRSSGNEFNTALKRERHPEPPQYPTSKVDERKRYSESRDARPKRSESRSQSSSRSSSQSSRSMKSAQNMTQGFVRSAVGMMAGAVIVTNSYQANVEERELARSEALRQAAIVEALDSTDWLEGAWTWSDDFMTVTLTVPDVGEIVATVTETEEPPTCLEDGTITYTATAELAGHSFTDERVGPGGSATGHTFGAPDSSDGETVFRCEDCGEEFAIGYGITKEN